MYHPPTVRGVEIPQEQQRLRQQPPNQVWLDAIMSKSRSTEPSPSNSSVAGTPHAHAHPHAHAPPPKHARMLVDDAGSTWRPVDQAAAAAPPPPPPPMADARRVHRSSRSPSPVVTATALQALSVEASAVAENRYAEQLSLDHSALEALVLKALKDMVADQDCCFIARGECHLCNGTNLVPVVNFCPDFSPTHSLCREHLRSMHRVRLEDIFAGKNQPTVSKRVLRCTVCALSCPCSKCQLARDGEIARYKLWLAAPSHGSALQEDPLVERPGSTRSSDSEMDPNGRSSRSRPRERTPPPLPPATAMPKDDARSGDDSSRDNGPPQRHSRRSGSTEPVGAEFSTPYAEDKYDERGRRGVYAEEKPVDRTPFGYGAAVEATSGFPLMPARADEKKPVRTSRVPKRAAKESVPYPLDTSVGGGYASRGPTPRDRLLGDNDVTPAMASPSAASVLNCPDSEKSLVDLLSSLNQQVTPAVRFFADEEEPPLGDAAPSHASRVDEDEAFPAPRRNGIEDTAAGSVDGSDSSVRRQKRKREGAPVKQSDAVPTSSRVDGKDDTPSDQGRAESDNSSSSYRQKAPTPLATGERKAKPQQAGVSSAPPRPPSPSPRGRPSSRPKAATPTPVPKSSSRKREAPAEPIPTPPASSRRRKTEAAPVVPTASERKASRGPDHRGHAHKATKGPQTPRDGGRGRKKKGKRADEDSDEDVRYIPGEDEDDDDLMEEGGEGEGEEEDDDELDTNLDYCEVCLAAGDLVCCDICPRSFHLKCLKMTEDDLPEGDWQCAECKKSSYFESFMVSVAEKTTVPAKCLQIVQCLKSHPFAKQFLLPVENVPHYTAVVKQPMDLTTIEKKIVDGKYMVSGKGTLQGGSGATKILHLGSFAEDVRLVWGNCKLFNDDGSGITRAADHLSEGFEKLYQHVLNFVERTSSASKPSNQPSREEKKASIPARPAEGRIDVGAAAAKSALSSKVPAAKSVAPSVQAKNATSKDSGSTTSQLLPNGGANPASKTAAGTATNASEPKPVSEESVAKDSAAPAAQAQKKPEPAAPKKSDAEAPVTTTTVKPTPTPSAPRVTSPTPTSSGSVTPSPTDSTTTTFVDTSATSKSVSTSVSVGTSGALAANAGKSDSSAPDRNATSPSKEDQATTEKAPKVV